MQSRREFLITAGLTAVSLSVFGCVIPKESETEGVAFGGDCTTTDDILGPFYRKNAPERSNIVLDEHGEAPIIEVHGTVFQGDCSTPLEGSLVEIWQANHNGDYDNKSSDYNYRAVAKIGSDGKYSFTTIVPGRYMNGNQYRPSHIHFRVRGKDHKELISQIYFKDDPYIEADPWASQSKARKRILPITENTDGYSKVQFDIYLDHADA